MRTLMKNLSKFLFAVITMMAFSVASFAQSATATASATIVAPIAITKTVDMNFGNVAVAAVAGTVTLDPAGTRTAGGGVTLPATTGTVAAAEFDVTGAVNFTYAITLPAAAVTIDDGAANTMTVTAFTSTPSGTGDLGAGGAQTITVGATLNVGANQVPGTYLSATPFTVTVNYN